MLPEGPQRKARTEDVEDEIYQRLGDIYRLNEEEVALAAAVPESQVELKRAGENRLQESNDFQQ